MNHIKRNDIKEAIEADVIEAEAIMKDEKFENGFEELQELDDLIIVLQREFNLKRKRLLDTPPDNVYMQKWQELQELKPYPVDEYK
jgi:hypothetical protein